MKLRQRRRLPLLPARGAVLAVPYLLITGLLAACSSIGSSPREAGQSPLQQERHPYLLTVDLQAGDDREMVAGLFGGEVIVWAEDDFAVLGFGSDPQAEAGFSTLGAGRSAVSEPNSEVSITPAHIRMQGTSGLWAGGTSGLWAGGTSELWAGGTSWLWAGGTSDLWAGGTSWLWGGGTFEMLPSNTDTLMRIGLDRAHGIFSEAGQIASSVRVAVIDTGLDLDHDAFEDEGVVDPGPDYVSPEDGDGPREVSAEEGEGHAGYGHGTSVAGIVRQVAPLATIVPVRILDRDGRGDSADLAKAIVWAVDQGRVDVINVSLGGERQVRAVDAAIRYAGRHGVIVVASAGDSGTTEVTYPAAAAHRRSNLLSVSSVASDDSRSDFSPYHPFRIDLTAPGEQIYGPAPADRMAAWSGTSMAAPMVSGALALAIAAERAGWDLQVPRSGFPEVLLATTDDISASEPRYSGALGRGRLNVATFLNSVLGIEDASDLEGDDDGRDDAGRDDDSRDDDRPGRGRGHGGHGGGNDRYDRPPRDLPPERFERRSPSLDRIFDRWRGAPWGSSGDFAGWGRER